MSTVNSSKIIATSRYTLSPEVRAEIEHAKSHYPDARAASIDALKLVQKEHGYVPDGAMYAIGEILGIPAADVEGVATFYSQIFRVPVGRHIIRVCDSMTCYVNGADGVMAEIQKQLGIVPGQTTADERFTLIPVCCLGNCDKGATIMIDDDTHGGLEPSMVAGLLEKYA